ncbi:LacI family DNA-binding transcriptional regulator [Nocardioides sp. NPDC087217]|uniref:LacI family DNA-binding transcriptional regulator n=1 Tax=Nocardioides sp. NPDC087217 TaxID=3364335 RepID=UPI00381AB39B
MTRRVAPRRATIATVAERAGVSTATVSRVLNGGVTVSEAVHERVLAAVEALNYRPSDLTRAVFAGRTNSIGLLLADLHNPYYVDLVEGVSRVANPSGTLPYLALSNRDPETERKMLSLMDSHRVRGLITVARKSDDLVMSMAEAGTECVLMARDTEPDHPRIHVVRLDDRAAGSMAWEHLAETGRSRILVVSQDTPAGRDRFRGLADAAKRDGVTLPVDAPFMLDNLAAPSEKLRELIASEFKNGTLDAVFAATGISTLRTFEAINSIGLRIPDDIAFLAFEDFAWAEHMTPSLSTIVQPAVKMGMAAASIILDEPGSGQRLRFEPKLVARSSTAV